MRSSWAQYTICLEDGRHREEVMQRLKEADIPTAVYYKKPLHQQEALKQYAMDELECAVTEQICKCCLSLPMHAYLKSDDVERIGTILIM